MSDDPRDDRSEEFVTREEGVQRSSASVASAVAVEREERDEMTGGGPTVSVLDEADRSTFRQRWEAIQTRFVDDPRQSVEEADDLVSEAIERLNEKLGELRSSFESEWRNTDGDVSTETLRRTTQRYRAVIERLMSL